MTSNNPDQDIIDRRRAVLEQKQLVTGKIGEICRFIGFALLAVFYTISSSNNEFSKKISATSDLALYVIGAAGVLTILFDYLQYFFGSIAVNQALANEEDGYKYNSSHFSYRLRGIFYYVKQAMAFLGSFVLTVLILMS